MKKPSFVNPIRAGIWICLGATLLLASCAAPALRNQFHNYNEAYAAALNQQMLLNLARLANGHPAYYLAIGLIDNKYTFASQTSGGTSDSVVSSTSSLHDRLFNKESPAGFLSTFTRALQNTLGFNLSEQASISSNPEFQFIPINNESAARQVLEPVSPDVFLSLYQQGYPIDLLMRTMIERIETPELTDNTQYTLVNSPKCGNPENYEDFLRICAMLRTLQENGYLTLKARLDYDPVGQVSFGTSQPNPNRTTDGGGSTEKATFPSLKDFMDAEDKNLKLSMTNEQRWLVSRKHATPKFYLRAEGSGAAGKNGASALAAVTPVIEFLKQHAYYSKAEENYGAITNLVAALYAGISIQTDVVDNGAPSTKLVLRSFNRTMESVANEQACFEALAKRDPRMKDMVPDFERRPILQLVWTDKKAARTFRLEKVDYAGKTYEIADPVLDPLNPVATWNRDVYCLLVELSSQVTVDISKFQRQVLELSQ